MDNHVPVDLVEVPRLARHDEADRLPPRLLPPCHGGHIRTLGTTLGCEVQDLWVVLRAERPVRKWVSGVDDILDWELQLGRWKYLSSW